MPPAAAIARIALFTICAGAAAAQAGQSSSTFQIELTIRSACEVTLASTDIDLGAVATQPGVVNQDGSTALKVNCSKKTPFFIGLAPSDGNRNGSGRMSGARPGNGAKVPYTLYSNAALTRVWGNTATSTRRGNGVAGTGTGMAAADTVSLPVYAKVTNVNFTPDRYADTVTVRVHY